MLATRPNPQNARQLRSSSYTGRPLEVVVAGGGIGGLTLALALKSRGVPVTVLERDLTAVRGEGKYRGPIQVQSNALAALEAINPEVAERIKAAGCVTGDRVNGLVDGVSGAWYCKFDTFGPAARNGLPVTRVISRIELQAILAEAVGPGTIRSGVTVDGFAESDDGRVSALLSDGGRVEGDVLIASDGIRSRLRRALLGDASADNVSYSQYTCYTGICDFVPVDIDTVGYRVFLGNRQYFVSSDVGGGRMQWYAFHNEPAGGEDLPGTAKARLGQLFGSWCDAVTDLITATPEEDVLRRDIYDRPPILTWARGRVALLGDSAHAMQPNLGQGGCMAIEDAHKLSVLLAEASTRAESGGPAAVDVPRLLREYQSSRVLRCGAIHGMAAAAAVMATTYKAYLGEGLGPLGTAIERLQIIHPGRAGGYLAMRLAMPAVLGWVLGGNAGALADGRVSRCSLAERPRGFSPAQFSQFLADDDALLAASTATLTLSPWAGLAGGTNGGTNGGIGGNGRGAVTVPRGGAASLAGGAATVEDEGGLWYVTDTGSDGVRDSGVPGVWTASPARATVPLTWRKLAAGVRTRLRPGDYLALGDPESDSGAAASVFRVKNGPAAAKGAPAAAPAMAGAA